MRIATTLIAALAFASAVQAQICNPLPDGNYLRGNLGQRSNVGVAPVCNNLVSPQNLFVNGNPDLTISAMAPPDVPAASGPTALLFLAVEQVLTPPPAGLVFCGYAPYPTGSPEVPLLTPFDLPGGIVALPTGPAPGGAAACPIPPGLIPPGLPGFFVMTIGIDFTSGPEPCIWATDAIRFGTTTAP